MSQVARIGNGIKVGYASGSPHTWKKLELVTNVKIPMLTPDKIDSTLSGTSAFKRSFNGMLTVSDCEITMQRDNDSVTSPNQNSLFDRVATGDQDWWRVEIPSAGGLFEAYEFQARTSSFEPSAEVTAKQTVVVKISFDGTSFTRQDPMASQLG